VQKVPPDDSVYPYASIKGQPIAILKNSTILVDNGADALTNNLHLPPKIS